jgi:hypothetical protein
MPTGKTFCFGLYTAGRLYAVIVFGPGVNPNAAAFLESRGIIEILRLCRSEPRLSFQLSRFIRLSIKMVRKNCQFDTVVAYDGPRPKSRGYNLPRGWFCVAWNNRGGMAYDRRRGKFTASPLCVPFQPASSNHDCGCPRTTAANTKTNAPENSIYSKNAINADAPRRLAAAAMHPLL